MSYTENRNNKSTEKEKEEVTKDLTVTTKFDTKIIPLKPPRNDSFSKASPLHYKFNYSDPQYDIIDNKHKVVTFNTLATCYALKSNSYATYCSAEHLKGEYRFTEIAKILKKCDGDIIALQEIDKPSKTLKWMQLRNNDKYKIFYNKRTNKKQDGLLLGYRTNKYKLYKDTPLRVIKLNDLTLGCNSQNSQTYYRKDQIAIYLLLQPINNPKHILFIINTHLYWHPDACNVRLRQIAYLLNIINDKYNKIKESDREINNISLIFCGDFNSLPNTPPHKFMINGCYLEKAKGNTELKLMMDSALNKVARWCRSLGVDCNYFSEQKLDTNNADKLFNLCKNEDRILITRSKRLVARKECPSHLLLNNHIPRDNLKQIIKYFGIKYDDDAIYTRCTLCNGYFKQLKDKKEINQSQQIPESLKLKADTMLFWKCMKCGQIYWFGDKSKSEVEKFKKIFDEANIEIDKELKESKEKIKRRLLKKQRQREKAKYRKQKKEEKEEKESNDEKIDEFEQINYESDIGDLDDKLMLLPNLQRFFWEDVKIINPFGQKINCSYSDCNGKSPIYTNNTSKFSGCLDYIFYADLFNKYETGKNIKCIDSRLIEGNKKYYPNSSWPSDHILLQSVFKLQ